MKKMLMSEAPKKLRPIMNMSAGSGDALTGPGACGTGATALPGLNPANTHAAGRCRNGPRLSLWSFPPGRGRIS